MLGKILNLKQQQQQQHSYNNFSKKSISKENNGYSPCSPDLAPYDFCSKTPC
jgi:hypothetical protein